MRKRRVIFAAVACVVGAFVAAIVWPREREPEPVYKGKKLSKWVERYWQATSEGLDGAEEEMAIRQIGTNSLPWLVKWIREESEPRPWRRRLTRAVDQLPSFVGNSRIVGFLLEDRRDNRRTGALHSFHVLGPPGISELTRLMNASDSEKNLRDMALAGLCVSGRDGLPPLLTALNDQKREDRATVVACIGMMDFLGTDVSLAVPELVKALSDEDVGMREAVTNVLMKIAPEVLEKAGGNEEGSLKAEK